MAFIEDKDRFFSGKVNASTPKHLIGEGEVARLLNARFIEGAITNAIGFEELEITFPNNDYISRGNVSYSDLLARGDFQLLAPLSNVYGKFLIAIISGVIFQINLDNLEAVDITPIDSFLTEESITAYPLSFIDNDGDIYGVGGYLVIFNYPNRPIFVSQYGARISNAFKWEMPVARIGATGGSRAFVISANNILYASDPLGAASSSAPLTFQETLDPAGTYTGQIFTIGSSLDMAYITAVCRIPRLLGVSEDFLAQSLLFSTKNKKYIVQAGAPRTDWESIQFISYGGTSDGIAGPQACTNIGSSVLYISHTGRIKNYAQDQDRDSSLVETYMDESLGQYLGEYESSFYFRPYYKTLNHSKGYIKYTRDRLYATVYPYLAPALSRYREKAQTYTHRALAVASLDPATLIGPQASLTWECFLTWLNPVALATLDNTLYVASKNEYGKIQFFKESFTKIDEHKSTIFTRGYFAGIDGRGKTLSEVTLYFRVLYGSVKIRISYLVNNKWTVAGECTTSNKLVRFTVKPKCKSDSWGVPLKIEIDHNGCKFELESVRVEGDSSAKEK